MLRWLNTNLRLFLLAFALALAVWVSAVTSADPDETRTYPGAVPIEYIGQDPGLVVIGQVPQSVQLTLRAPRSVWNQLLANNEAIRVVADLSGLDAGQNAVTLQVQVRPQPVRVLEVTPATIYLSLEPLATRSLPVEVDLVGEPAIGYQVGELRLDPAQAAISGPQSAVERVARLQASLELSSAREPIERTVALQAIDQNGAPVTGVTIQPASVQISLPVTQIGGYRDLVVKVVTRGQPASGYRLTNISPSPLVVTVYSANLDLINSLPGYVETMPLDLSGMRDDLETRLNLVLPSGVTLVGEQTVLVQVGIAPIQGGLTLSYRPIAIAGLGSGLQAQVSPATVDVILSGPLPALDSLQTSDIRVTVNLNGLGPGVYQIAPLIEILAPDVTVESVLPATVQVTITSLSTPTP
ncbi:MAG: CdaR family protein [Anaerolineales bacterium]